MLSASIIKQLLPSFLIKAKRKHIEKEKVEMKCQDTVLLELESEL